MSNLTLDKLQSDSMYQTAVQKWQDLGLKKEDLVKEMQFCVMAISESEHLQKCDAKSVFNSIISIVSCGLTFNPAIKLAYLVPYGSTCKPMPSYLGLSKLVTDTGACLHIECQVVYQGDDFDMDLASEKKILKHKPYIATGNKKGDMLAVYSVAYLQNNVRSIELMSKEDIAYIRDNFSKNKTLWGKHEIEMFRKTVIKRHTKHLPKSYNAGVATQMLYNAIKLDHEAGGFDDEVGFEQLSYIEKLINTSGYDKTVRGYLLETVLPEVKTKSEAQKLIKHLQENQVFEIPTNQTGIAELVKAKVNDPNS